MNYEAVAETIRSGYREVTPQYRRDDEIEVTTRNHAHISGILRKLCVSFDRPIRALDVGCGTGRYFHCLTNVQQLLGIDITEEMLRAAEHPVREDEVTIPEIRLVCANFYLTEFPPGAFDLIYSLGMFGNGCPVTTAVCNRFHKWLAPGGKLFFNTVDVAGMPASYRIKRQIRGVAYPFLPPKTKARLDERAARHPFYGMSRRELASVLKQSQFKNFEVTSNFCESPLWNGRHLECIASKD
ncbi:MAG TPA: class I SAM-dependent methyltransferase [Verrucomicrobiae bacterium]|nr:class I SAM-dependent methyltransferase [Verrucomicrobiae bacterium]